MLKKYELHGAKPPGRKYSPVQSPNMSVPVTNMAVHWPIMGTQYLTQYEGGQTPDHISSLFSIRQGRRKYPKGDLRRINLNKSYPRYSRQIRIAF